MGRFGKLNMVLKLFLFQQLCDLGQSFFLLSLVAAVGIRDQDMVLMSISAQAQQRSPTPTLINWGELLELFMPQLPQLIVEVIAQVDFLWLLGEHVHSIKYLVVPVPGNPSNCVLLVNDIICSYII